MTEKTGKTAAPTAKLAQPTALRLLACGLRLGVRRTTLFVLLLGLLGAPFSSGLTLLAACGFTLYQIAIGTPVFFPYGAIALRLTPEKIQRTPRTFAAIAAMSMAITLLALTALSLSASGSVSPKILWGLGLPALLIAPVWGYALGQVFRDQGMANG